MGHMYFLIAMLIISSYIGASAAKYIGVIGNRPWESIFMPDHIEPTRYDLRISPDFHNNDSYFNGHVVIHLYVKTRTDIIMIHSKQLQINSWTVMDSKHRRLAVSSYFPYERHDYLVFKTKYPLPKRAKLELSFFGNISTVEEGDPVTPNGLYKIPYVDQLNGKQSWVLVSDFRHGGSRFAFPSFDDPQFKAKFNIIIRHRKNFTALTNMPLKSQESYARLYDLSKFKLSPKMTTDHVRITISEFSFKNATVTGTEYRVWARPDRLNEVDYALNVTTTLQNYLFQELGQSYLLERFDQFAVPGSLVHDNSKSWGLATYKESRLLVNVTEEADDTKDEALKLIAKTVAHGYFETYSYSHNRIRHHYWLKEGLTKFYATRALRAIDPTLFHMELYSGEGHTLFLDGTDKTRPLVADAPGFDNINPVLGYKGAGILRMVESFVGRDAFRLGVIKFLQDYRNRTIKTRKFFRAIQQNAGLSLRLNNIMQTWVFGNGTPVIRVELLPGDVINATQKQFLFHYKLSGNNTQKWYVPLTYRTGEGNNGLVWMNETDVVFNVALESSDDWIVFNGERSGYYRVQYDANLMNRIVKQLNENHTVFTELTRSTLLNDAITFADANQLGYDIFLSLTKYASNEADLTPWLPIADGFHEIYKHIRHTNISNRFQSYVLNLTSKLMDEFLANDAVSNLERQLRRTIMRLSCAAGHEGCIEIGIREFQTWIQNQTHVVPEHDRPEAYCNAMANSVDEGDWMTTFERFVQANSTRERDQLLYILCCSRNLTILQWLLDFSMNVTDRHTRSENVFDETHVIMENIARNPSANAYMWNWFKSNFAEIDRVFQIGSAGILVAAPASEFTTQAQNEELLEFYNTYNGSIPDRWQKRTKNQVKRNLRWMGRHFNTITRWLEQDASAK